MAEVRVDNDFEHTVIVRQPEWTLLVTPSYKEKELSRPFKVTTSVLFPPEKSTLLSLGDSELKLLIERWQAEMLPEYSLTTQIDVRNRIVLVTFTMFEVGKFPEIDAISKSNKGCWKECVRR
jgi:hypothetical protein